MAIIGGEGPKDLFNLPLVAVNTAMLLSSSITYGFLDDLHAERQKGATLFWLAVTGLFWPRLPRHRTDRVPRTDRRGQRPAAFGVPLHFFTLVGTHGLHVTFGCIWLVTLMVQVAAMASPPPTSAAPVPLAVLALPRRGVDRRVYLCLSDGMLR